MTSFAQKVAMWVGAIVIAIALGGLAFWIVSNIGPKEPSSATPSTTTQQPPPAQPVSTQPVDIQVTGTVVRTNPGKLEIYISEVVLESPTNITLCRTENILVRLRQSDPFPSENARVRVKGEYNHQECSITLKSANHSISVIPGVIYPITLTATLNQINDARNLIRVKVLEVQAGPEPCTRENLTVRLKDPLPPPVNVKDKAEIQGNYNSATCEVRLDTPDTSITFLPVLIELRGTVREISGNRHILYNWDVLLPDPDRPMCAQKTADFIVLIIPGPNAKQVPPNRRVVVKGDYSPIDCIIQVDGNRSDHSFAPEPVSPRMIVEGTVSSFEPRQKMELIDLNVIEGGPPCDASRLVVDLTDRRFRNTILKAGDRVRVEGTYYEAECKLYAENISNISSDTAIFPGFLTAGLIVSSQVTLYSAGFGLRVYDRLFVHGTFGTGSGTTKLKTGVTMSLNVTAFALSASYRVLDNFYLSAGAGALLVKQLVVAWTSTVFVPIVRICLGYRMGFFMVEGGFYVSLGPIQ